MKETKTTMARIEMTLPAGHCSSKKIWDYTFFQVEFLGFPFPSSHFVDGAYMNIEENKLL